MSSVSVKRIVEFLQLRLMSQKICTLHLEAIVWIAMQTNLISIIL